jgi:putative flippase GtrA
MSGTGFMCLLVEFVTISEVIAPLITIGALLPVTFLMNRLVIVCSLAR